MFFPNDQVKVSILDHNGSKLCKVRVIVHGVFDCPSGKDGTEISLQLNGSLQLATGVYRAELLQVNDTVIRAVNIKKDGDILRIDQRNACRALS
jgi:hypothetical protein